MLTIREALELPALQGATLVAGEGGLDNPIRWVHIVDLPHPKFEWVQGGELLLTSGYGLSDEADNPIPMLAEKGLAGIVLSRGGKFERTPASLCKAADDVDLPIIETPPDLAFIDVTEAILGKILDQQTAVRQHGDEIHRSLMEQVLEGDSLQGVAEALSEILGRSITVEDDALDVLAAAEVGPVDEARKRSIREGRTNPELINALIDRGIYTRLMKERGPLYVSPIPELGMTMERIVAPIFVAHRIVGYVWIISGDRALTELDELAIEHTATVAAVILLKEQEIQRAELEQQGDLLQQLLHLNGPPDPLLLGQVQRLGFHADRPFRVLLIEGTSTPVSLLDLPQKVKRWLENANLPALVTMEADQVIAVLQNQPSNLGKPLADRLATQLSTPNLQLLMGLGGLAVEISDLGRSFTQAGEALDVAHRLDREQGMIAFDDLGSLHWFNRLPPETLEENVYFQAIRALDEHDGAHRGKLLHSLGAFLQTGGKTTEAARKLNLHRNTLSYRIRRIEELLEVDLTDPDIRFELLAALKVYRLRSSET